MVRYISGTQDGPMLTDRSTGKETELVLYSYVEV